MPYEPLSVGIHTTSRFVKTASSTLLYNIRSVLPEKIGTKMCALCNCCKSVVSKDYFIFVIYQA